MNNLIQGYPVIIKIPVAWGEMDVFQHVNSCVYFRYFESARFAYFEKLDIAELMNRTGIGPILAATSCKYKVPLAYPDEVLVGVKATQIEEDRFTIKHLVVSTKQQKVAAEGEAIIVAFNYRESKRATLPDELRQRILNIENAVK